MRNCPVCHEPVEVEAERCPACGHSLPPPVDERWQSLAGTPIASIAAEPPEGDYPDPDMALPPPADPTHTAHGTPVSLLSTEPPECDDEPPEAPGAGELSNRAVAAVEAGDFEAAFAGFRRSLELAPGAAETWFRIGGAYYRQQAFRHAAAAFARTLEFDPGHPRARYWLARARGSVRSTEPEVSELIAPASISPAAANEPTLPLAGPARRLPALVADGVLLWLILLAMRSVVAGLAYLFSSSRVDFLSSDFYGLGKWIAALYFMVGYFTVFHAVLGQTPGMMLMGLRLVDRRGEGPGVLASLFRTVFFGLFNCLSLFTALVSRGRSLHDWMCGTYVVHAD